MNMRTEHLTSELKTSNFIKSSNWGAYSFWSRLSSALSLHLVGLGKFSFYFTATKQTQINLFFSLSKLFVPMSIKQNTKMKTNFLIVFILLIPATIMGQVYSAQDGSTFELENVNSDPDQGRNAEVYLGIFGPEGLNLIGISYLKPTKYFFNVAGGHQSIFGEANIFLHSWKKQRHVRSSLAGYGHIRYVAKVLVEKRRSFGLHVGANYFNDYILGTADVTTTAVFTGFSLLRSSHVHWKVKNGYAEVQGTAINRLNLDVVRYINPQLNSADYTTIEEEAREIGARLLFDGKVTIWSRGGRVSLHYMLGVSIPLSKRVDVGVPGGLGIGYNFK